MKFNSIVGNETLMGDRSEATGLTVLTSWRSLVYNINHALVMIITKHVNHCTLTPQDCMIELASLVMQHVHVKFCFRFHHQEQSQSMHFHGGSWHVACLHMHHPEVKP